MVNSLRRCTPPFVLRVYVPERRQGDGQLTIGTPTPEALVLAGIADERRRADEQPGQGSTEPARKRKLLGQRVVAWPAASRIPLAW
jgi:hypothetical protein